ncbi:MAG: hypothetical protein FWC36_02210 [Spirochaetes bacterium]|nr:hypothetical protein [Spirochaetota bacterium]
MSLGSVIVPAGTNDDEYIDVDTATESPIIIIKILKKENFTNIGFICLKKLSFTRFRTLLLLLLFNKEET